MQTRMDYSQAVSSDAAQQAPTLVRGVSLFDATLLIVGGTLGSGLFLTSSDVAAATHTPWLFFLAWVAGAVVALLASLPMAELGAMFPESGGQYIYLREAYGDFAAFLYGWMIFTINVTGSLAALAAGFAAYTGALFPVLASEKPAASLFGHVFTIGQLVAAGALLVLTWINIIGLRRAVWLQNVASIAKFSVVGLFLLLGFAMGHGSWANFSQPLPGHASAGTLAAGFGLAMIAVLWVYDGWVYITWIAGEVREPQRTIPRALLYGVASIGAIVVLLNVLYLYAMPMSSMREQTVVLAGAANALFTPAVAHWMSALVALSCFGAAASCMMGGSRVYYAMAKDGLFFRRLSEVHPRYRTPALSLAVQCVWSIVLVLTGRYDQLFTYVMFVSVIAYALAASSLFVLRRKLPRAARPFLCPGYPWVPALYCLIGLTWAASTLVQRPRESLAGIGIMLLGTPAYWWWRRDRLRARTQELEGTL